MKNQWLYTLCALVTTQPTFAGGALIGSGSDALAKDETQDVRPLGDVVVPVPPEMSSYGQLLVSGTPGNSQVDIFRYTKCEKGKDTAPKKFSCKGNFQGKLNDLLSLKPGYYEINYGGSYTPYLVEIKQDAVSEVSLRKIQIPRVNGNFSVEVFLDFSAASMRDLSFRLLFGNSERKESTERLCSHLSKSSPYNIRTVCEAWKTDDYRNLNIALIRFTNDGKISFLKDDGSFEKPWRAVVKSNAKAGDFISVFPGVYGITFTDMQSGEAVTQQGIYVD
ncbi:MAG: hypothetical protein ACXVCY_02180 [Pseudobdellovibrionaceae bacterium]